MSLRSYLTFGICIALAVWLVGILGLLNLPEGLFYDKFVTLTPEVTKASSNILLIDADLDRRSEGDGLWLELLETIERMKPAKVVFTFLPKQASKKFYDASSRYGNVIFGREIVSDVYNPDKYFLEPLPAAAEDSRIIFGVVSLPDALHGIYRHSHSSFHVEGAEYPSLEAVAAESSAKGKKSFPEEYMVNFNGKLSGLPNIGIQRAMTGGIIKELVSGKTVVIGFEKSGTIPGLHTPIISKDKTMSMLEFHGYAIDTLMSKSWIRRAGPWLKFLLLIVIIFINLAAYKFLNIRLSFLFAFYISILSSYLILTWLTLSYFSAWPPLIEILTLQIGLSIFTFTRKAVVEEEGTKRMLIETSVKLEKRFLPESFYTSEEYWAQLIVFVSQTLQLNKVIFLEKVEDDHRLREVKSLNCLLSDIFERRRDYEREPYSTAITENGPVEVKNRQFFKEIGESEREYVVPLIFANDVLGFWAFTIEPAAVPELSSFIAVVRDYAAQISELLFQRRQRELKKRELSGIKKLMRHEVARVFYKELNENMALLEERLTLLEKMLDDMNTSTILYDLFGRVIYLNKQMYELLKSAGIAPYNMTALDLAVKLSGVEPERVRLLLQKVVLDRDVMSLSASLESDPNKAYILYVKPIIYDEGGLASSRAHPFHVLGTLFDLVDVSYLKALDLFKENLFTDMDYRLRNHILAINLASSLLSQEGLPEEQRKLALGMLNEKVTAVGSFLEEIQEYLKKDIFINDLELYPVDIKKPAMAGVEELSEEAALRKIHLDLKVPDLISFVFASPKLKDLIMDLVRITMNDSVEDGKVTITLEETLDWVICTFSNTGLGMPAELFKKYIYSDTEEITSGELKKLRAVIKQVKQWGGEFDASSDIGVGMRFVMRLKRAANE
jgi:CHASE2 domain-containing sensor protein